MRLNIESSSSAAEFVAAVLEAATEVANSVIAADTEFPFSFDELKQRDIARAYQPLNQLCQEFLGKHGADFKESSQTEAFLLLRTSVAEEFAADAVCEKLRRQLGPLSYTDPEFEMAQGAARQASRKIWVLRAVFYAVTGNSLEHLKENILTGDK